MSTRSKRRWIVAALLTVGIAGFAGYSMFERSRTSSNIQKWPLGDADDIERLAERDDLNVLFIVIDTLRADRLSAYGYERETSPNLDRLVSRGVRFGRHLAQSSWTKASMASIWTGYTPVRTGIRQNDDIIPEAALMAAEAMRDAGFQTIGLYRNGWVAPTFGFEQGFDVYTRPPSRGLPAAVKREKPVVSARGTDDDVIAAGLEFLRLDGHKPWFLYMHLMDLHEYTYDDESALFGGSYSDIYDNSIRWTDGGLGILIDWLFEWGLMRNTLIVIASDHGEAFRERGFEGHARFLFKETTEVPLLLIFPFRLEPGIVIASRTRNVDIWPTILDLIGVGGFEATDGVSLKPEILEAARNLPRSAGERTGFAQLNQNWARREDTALSTEAVVEGTHRYVRRISRGKLTEALFDSSRDPAELVDVAGERPEILGRMRAAADAEMAREPVWGEPEVRELNELELNQLRALGYAIP